MISWTCDHILEKEWPILVSLSFNVFNDILEPPEKLALLLTLFLLMAKVDEETVAKYNLKPIARIVSYADGAHEPEWFTTAPAIAAEKALQRAGLTIADIEFFEVNEAFAVVTLAFIKHFGLSQDKVNVNGGAVSMGHPLGCSGARIITTLTNVLAQNNGKYGMAAICNGGGGASAMIIERM